jgi:hypothetical protein
MIGHQQKQMGPPKLAKLAIADRFKDRRGTIGTSKVIFATREAIEC